MAHTRRFNRHENMKEVTRTVILHLIRKSVIRENEELINMLYGLFDGYDYTDAIMEIARVSLAGNKQHHPDKPLHWDRSKSTDDYDALARHLIDAGTVDDDGIRHTAKVAWRALACLQKELENEK